MFLRKNHDCEPLDLLHTRKKYTVIEKSDLTRNIPWLASHFSKIKKPNKNFSKKLCTENQSVIAGVPILTQFQLFIRK